jgi:hypothetical protein
MLIRAAILTFLVSLPLPAVVYRDGWARSDQTLDGWVCLLLGMPFYPSHLLLLLSPLQMWRMGKRRTGLVLRYVVAAVYTASAAWVLSTGSLWGLRGFWVGYYLWVASHCLAAAGFWIFCAYTSRPGPPAAYVRG